jgi:hypothetical protein
MLSVKFTKPFLAFIICLAAFGQFAFTTHAAKPVPFKGHSENQAISATPVDPEHVFVTTVGAGNATHLGKFTFVSPHLSGLLDFAIDGIQIFTVPNGDEIHTTLSGNLHPEVDESGHVFLVGDVAGVITGGTGRFANATGTFTFSLVFDTETFHSFAQIDGVIQYAGK